MLERDSMATKTLAERIGGLPPEARERVESFVTSLDGEGPKPLDREQLSGLLRRMDERRERLRQEVGQFDSVAAISELRDE